VELPKPAAVALLELIGPEFGLLDQEISRLALYAGPSHKITTKLVRELGGGWRAKTAWDMIDAALSGRGAEAIHQLDRLLQSGEYPQALFGSIAWSLRRFAAATRVYQRAERQRRRIRLSDALGQAGFFTWQKQALKTAEQQLKQLGRHRAGEFHQWLLETDLALKGSHSSPELSRLALERLLLRLDRQFARR
jgi:DNA polymerase-3 subunit delta